MFSDNSKEPKGQKPQLQLIEGAKKVPTKKAGKKAKAAKKNYPCHEITLKSRISDFLFVISDISQGFTYKREVDFYGLRYADAALITPDKFHFLIEYKRGRLTQTDIDEVIKERQYISWYERKYKIKPHSFLFVAESCTEEMAIYCEEEITHESGISVSFMTYKELAQWIFMLFVQHNYPGEDELADLIQTLRCGNYRRWFDYSWKKNFLEENILSRSSIPNPR
jgi:hypothetical protein